MTDPIHENEDNGAPVELDETIMPPSPAPVLEEEASEIEIAEWIAFNKGIDAMQRMFGGLCNKGHRRNLAQKAGVKIPPGE